ncbi:hypothetical protein M758_11G054300 [Ceratodon purpureus]|uniref:Uncharacterized protein n=1 Tax=Ceratodon purpureus TaxID=3225 RepID=A0A8T0GCL9_CERPU|nr:hypothetical protein KC19_11G056100 [Ceratodon purpureus]KAG0600701.1 hypothetical protein M758_11G054300 [Ceratodon purpureus]
MLKSVPLHTSRLFNVGVYRRCFSSYGHIATDPNHTAISSSCDLRSKFQRECI